jgi:hypothetical protein
MDGEEGTPSRAEDSRKLKKEKLQNFVTSREK